MNVEALNLFKKPIVLPIWIGRIIQYEYWPIWIFYIPVAFYLTYLALRARSLTFYTNINPAIKDSGIIHYSKYAVLELLPESIKPKSILIQNMQAHAMHLPGMHYPIICKPDMGERGKGVSLIRNESEFIQYKNTINSAFIIQEYVDFPYEAGIFYIRKPSEKYGRITSFTTKEFLQVTGTGHSSIKELMQQSFRARLQIPRLDERLLASVPAKGETIKLEPIGNHSRGTRFINSNDLITPRLERTFDEITKDIHGFYYGRFDIKFSSIEELEQGHQFKVVELNGINSEPTHIYDQRVGLIHAYLDFFKHLNFMFEISVENKTKGYPRTPVLKFLRTIFQGKHKVN